MIGPARLVCVTDVPTPYRNHLFELLHDELAGRGIELEVWFMATSAPDRFWRFGDRLGAYEYRIWPGLHPVSNGWAYHFNPGIVAALIARPPRWVMLGGAWNQPTIMLSAVAARIRARSRVIFWSEANRHSATHRRGPVALLRRSVLQLAEAFAVPGAIAEATIRDDWDVTGRPFVLLPNLIDERRFAVSRLDGVRRQELRDTLELSQDARVFLWPARLHEPTKGIINFLASVKDTISDRDVIIIAGEGPDRLAIQQWLDDHGMRTVRLVGHQTQDRMIDWLTAADVFLLPSLRDPNPLAVIEALWAGLPVMISSHCGNYPEAVTSGLNGWVVDPLDRKSLRAAYADAASAPAARLLFMGAASARIARQRFAATPALRAFADALIALDGERSSVPAPLQQP
jgi:glycosyltransferase involved in cell wall biosynthesis